MLNPFYNFIQPGRQQQNQSQQIDQRINQQQRQIGVLQQFQNNVQSSRGRGNLTQRATGVGPTGKGATFMNYGSFFQIRGGGGGGQRRR